MKRIPERIFALILSLLLLFPQSAAAKEKKRFAAEAEKAMLWEKEALSIGEKDSLLAALAPSAGETDSDWLAFALARLGTEEDYKAYSAALQKAIRANYEKEEKLGSNSTEWHRLALLFASFGMDPRSIGGIDLIFDGIFARSADEIARQGCNALAFSLITLKSADYSAPAGAEGREAELLALLLDRQLEDGGFPLGSSSDIDITAMALTSLSFFPGNSAAQSAIEKGLEFLSGKQNENGSFSSWGQENCLSCAQILIALSSLGIDPEADPRFVKKGGNPLSALLSYQGEDGGFAAYPGKESNQKATGQALMALAALDRQEEGSALYDLHGAKIDQKNGFSPLYLIPAILLICAGAFLIARRRKK